MDYLKLNEEKLRKLCEDGLRGKYKIKPKEVSVQVTNRCNNYCIMCHTCNKEYSNHTYFNEEPLDITFKQYKKLLPGLPSRIMGLLRRKSNDCIDYFRHDSAKTAGHSQIY